MPHVAFVTLGCKVNQFETEVIEGLFRERGYEVVPFEKEADVYVINTCSVTHLGEKKSRQLIRRATRTNPDATVVVTGCYAQVSPDKVEAIPGVNVIVGTRDRQQIVDLVEEASNSRRQVKLIADIMEAEHFEDIPLIHVPGRTRSFLKIQEGCANFCTYCIIPYARGPLRSRPLASVTAEAQKMVKAGFKEIVLTGIHLGAYGRDTGEGTLTDAIKVILEIPELMRLRLGSLESIEVPEELLRIMQQDKRLCPHLHLPLQSANDQILLSMNRHYTTDEYLRLLYNVRNYVSNVAVSTDIIVGFPGETKGMFEKSLELIETMEFSRIHVFPYSKRSGTPAASYPNQVSEEDKKKRVQQLQRLADQSAQSFNQRFIGSTAEVLFETEADSVMDGLAGNYIRIYTSGNPSLISQIKKISLKETYQDGIWGTVVN